MLEVIQCDALTKNVSRILLKRSENNSWQYQAGQYLKVMHQNGMVSPLSIANAPHHDAIELHLSHPENNSAAQDLLQLIQAEKKLQVQGPFGSCTSQKLIHQQPIIFLARGTGFAPIKSMLEDALTKPQHPHIHLFWSVTQASDFYLLSLLEDWQKQLPNFSFTPVVTQAEKNWTGATGLLQHAVLSQYPDITAFQVYISAPETIVHEVGKALSPHGLKQENYFSDIFDYVT